jgi:hypothetical protein
MYSPHNAQKNEGMQDITRGVLNRIAANRFAYRHCGTVENTVRFRKVNFALEQAMKAQRVSRDTVLFFL